VSRSVVNVDFIAEYKGAGKLTQAQKDMAHLRDGVMRLGKSFAAVFAVHELVKWGKESLQAFATNEKQVALLTNTLNNLGQGFAALSVNKYIDSMALATGKTKEELIPAFQGLFIATGNAAKAQDALKVAMDVSQGTGKDLAAVQVAISKGYLGNTVALTRLGAGLDKATLKTGNMDLIMKKLASTFKGDAAIAADTIQGKMDRLNVAMTEAKVTIGSGLVQALTELGGAGGFPAALKGIQDFATGISDAIIGTERLIKIIGFFVYNTKGTNPITQMNEFNKANAKSDMLARQVYGGAAATKYQGEVALATAKAKLKVDQASLKVIQDAKKATADKLAAERAALSLKLAGSTVDMQNIEIQAALQRGQTTEVNNVLLLQRAIITGNADQANILAQEVLKANGLVMDVNGNISNLASAKDPFGDWPAASKAAMLQLLAIQAELAKIQSKTITITVNTVNTTSGTAVTKSPSLIPYGDYVAPVSPAIAAKASIDAIIEYADAATARANAIADLVDAQNAIDAAAFNSSSLNVASAAGITSSVPVATAAAIQSGNRYAAQAAAQAASQGVTITVVAAPNVIVDTTQDASTNGTAVTVNRLAPLQMYSSS